MLFLFSVFWCWAIAEPFRGFAVFLQNFPVARSRLVGFSLSAARQGKIVPCYGAKISLPEDLDGALPDILSHWQNSDSRQMNRNGCRAQMRFSPSQQGESRRRVRPRNTWPAGGGRRSPRSIARGRAGLLRRG